MPQLIVLEGPDGSGKSTLARKYEAAALSVGAKVTCIHAVNPKPGQKSILPMFMPAIEALDSHDVVIMDRSPMSEAIYGAILRGHAIGYGWEWAMWNRFINFNVDPNLKITAMVLDASDEQLVQRAYGRPEGEHFVPIDKFQEIVNEYRSAIMTLAEYGWIYADISDE